MCVNKLKWLTTCFPVSFRSNRWRGHGNEAIIDGMQFVGPLVSVKYFVSFVWWNWQVVSETSLNSEYYFHLLVDLYKMKFASIRVPQRYVRLRYKHRTSIAFTWRHFQSAGEMSFNSMELALSYMNVWL